MSESNRPRAPWHLWLIGGVLLAYALLAAFDSVMTLSQGEAYMRSSGMNDSQLAFFTGLPVWFDIASFVSTWAGLLGAAMLLARRKAAGAVLLGAALATVVTCLFLYADRSGIAAMGVLWPMPAAIAAVYLLAAIYAGGQTRRGVLSR